MYSEARLGQVWQILTPLLNAAVYFLIFGVILDTRRGVPNFIPFLVTGVFVFNFTQRSFIIASRVINDSLPLIRALHFPRACLPLGYVLIELQQMAISMVVLIVIVLGFGEPFTWYWLLALPALALQTFFNVGVALILARVGAGVDDVSQLIPFIVRTWMYASGVMFFIPALADPVPARQAELPAADQPGGGLHLAGQERAADVAADHRQHVPAIQPRPVRGTAGGRQDASHHQPGGDRPLSSGRRRQQPVDAMASGGRCSRSSSATSSSGGRR